MRQRPAVVRAEGHEQGEDRGDDHRAFHVGLAANGIELLHHLR